MTARKGRGSNAPSIVPRTENDSESRSAYPSAASSKSQSTSGCFTNTNIGNFLAEAVKEPRLKRLGYFRMVDEFLRASAQFGALRLRQGSEFLTVFIQPSHQLQFILGREAHNGGFDLGKRAHREKNSTLAVEHSSVPPQVPNLGSYFFSSPRNSAIRSIAILIFSSEVA